MCIVRITTRTTSNTHRATRHRSGEVHFGVMQSPFGVLFALYTLNFDSFDRIFGLCNNFGYVVMLSAAEDILKVQQNVNSENLIIEKPHILQGTSSAEEHHVGNGTHERNCTIVSTGAVLLADILPTLLVKTTAPFFMMLIPFG